MSLEIRHTGLEGLATVKHDPFRDHRGFFYEIFNEKVWRQAGLNVRIAQVNHSRSTRDVIRGLHFQWDPPMGKLMQVTSGRAFMVAVDIRYDSPTRGKWYGVEASAEDKLQLWGEAGFARGFCALSKVAEIQYLCTAAYNADAESSILWDDPGIGIRWPVTNPTLSAKDRTAQTLAQWLSTPEAKKVC